MVFFYKVHKAHHDSLFHIYENHITKVFNRRINKHKHSRYNQQHLHFYHNNSLLNVFSYKDSIIHYDNFFHIYAFHILTLFNIFCHIETLLFLSYT